MVVFLILPFIWGVIQQKKNHTNLPSKNKETKEDVNKVNPQNVWENVSEKIRKIVPIKKLTNLSYPKFDNENHEALKTNLTLCTYNINSINNKILNIITYMEKQKLDGLFIQKSHITVQQENYIKNEFIKKGYEAIFANKTEEEMKQLYTEKKINKINNRKDIGDKDKEKEREKINTNFYKKSGGLITIMKKEIFHKFEYIKIKGKRIIISKTRKNKKLALVNIYTSTGNHLRTNNFIEHGITEQVINLKKEGYNNIIIGGDWNAMINEKIDR